MKTPRIGPLATVPLLLATLLAGCAGPKTAERSETGKVLQDAERYVSTLREQNQLPGFTSTEHGRLIAMAPWRSGSVSYPASVTVRAWKEGDEATYCYAVVKDNQQTPWHLVNATRLDKHGKVVEELNSQ